MRKSRTLIDRLPELSELAAAARYHPAAVAELCGMTLRSLERECRKCLDTSPQKLLNAEHRRKAERLLSSKLAKQVFHDLGYQSPRALSRWFKTMNTGLTIKEWQVSQPQPENRGRSYSQSLSRNETSESSLQENPVA